MGLSHQRPALGPFIGQPAICLPDILDVPGLQLLREVLEVQNSLPLAQAGHLPVSAPLPIRRVPHHSGPTLFISTYARQFSRCSPLATEVPSRVSLEDFRHIIQQARKPGSY
jgi:hypothetical protein